MWEGKNDGALEKVARRGCGVSIYGDIQEPSECLPVRPTVGYLLWQGGWTQWSKEVPSSLYSCVILQ